MIFSAFGWRDEDHRMVIDNVVTYLMALAKCKLNELCETTSFNMVLQQKLVQ